MKSTIELLDRFGWSNPQPPIGKLVGRELMEALYMAWLYGASTRALARVCGCDKNTVIRALERVYGLNAVNRSAKSLLISLAEDYPECVITENFIRSNLLLQEKEDGETVAVYMSIYPGGRVIHKELRVPKYQQHRSNIGMQHISNNEVPFLEYSKTRRSKDDPGEG